MNIDLSDKQLELLKDVLSEYSEGCYHTMFEYRHTAVDAEDEFIKNEYSALAQSEETRFKETQELLDYITKFEELMKKR